jgi:endonuclease/exonuclease/phosphatase (EEP) superfamily protein YafD
MRLPALRRRLRLLALALLYAGLAALAGGTVLAEFGGTWWLADLFAHFRYHYALGAALLVLVALALGRRGSGLAAACLVLPQLWAVAAPPRTPVEPPAAAAAGFRVISANVHHANRRFDALVSAIERERPDIVALQEISSLWHATVERLAARLPHVAPADWRTGRSDNILLSRFPIRDSRLMAPPGQYRAFAHVEAALSIAGRDLRVLVVHPPVPNGPDYTATRQAHLDYYARLAAQGELPLLIVGDLNITPYSPRFRALLRAGRLNYVHLGWAWPASWPSASRRGLGRFVRGFPIDHILTSGHFAVAEARVLEDVGSDHYPVLADLHFRR